MQTTLKSIEDIGFSKIGKWMVKNSKLSFDIVGNHSQNDGALYAFTSGSQVLYLGKTSRSLRTRLSGYKNPPRDARNGASTNIRVNRNILESAARDETVEIYALINERTEDQAGLQIDFAASIESSLIRSLAPAWNYKPASQTKKNKEIAMAKPDIRNAKKIKSENRTAKASPEPRTEDYAKQLEIDLKSVSDAGIAYLVVRSGDLHKKTGGRNSYTTCCGAMRKFMTPDDVIEKAPPGGNGGNLYIRYKLPRPNR